jgi:hypothetical protein
MRRTIKGQSERKISNICINRLIIRTAIVIRQSLCFFLRHFTSAATAAQVATAQCK